MIQFKNSIAPIKFQSNRNANEAFIIYHCNFQITHKKSKNPSHISQNYCSVHEKVIFKRECNLTAIKYTFRISLSHFAKLVITPSNYAHLIAFDLHFIATTQKIGKLIWWWIVHQIIVIIWGFSDRNWMKFLLDWKLNFLKNHTCALMENLLFKRDCGTGTKERKIHHFFLWISIDQKNVISYI